MEQRRLGPVVGLGTWNTFDTDEQLADDVVTSAAEAGVRLFDTSPMYRGAEQSLAAALDGIRDEVAVATKIWAHSLEEGSEGSQSRPVRVFTISYGEGADTQALSTISQATNAATYNSSNPASIEQVFTAVISNF